MEFIAALDQHTSIQQGENGHVEYGSANDIQSKIVQFDFQCVRSQVAEDKDKLEAQWIELLSAVTPATEGNKIYREMIYRMIGKVRDVHGGKGEYSIAYMMIWNLYSFYPLLAVHGLHSFVSSSSSSSKREEEEKEEKVVPYGSWKDIKYFCNYAKSKGAKVDHPLIQHAIQWMNDQLREDSARLSESESESISLCGKWAPRQSSNRFGWLTPLLATHYYSDYMATATTEMAKRRAHNKCLTEFRKVCARLNRHLDTIQIKQCAQTPSWHTIDHAKTTSITMIKQRKALLNESTSNRTKKMSSTDRLTGVTELQHEISCQEKKEDRVQCANNLKAYIQEQRKGNRELKGANVSLEQFSKEVVDKQTSLSATEIDMINSQWRDNRNKKNGRSLGKMIAMVDSSGSMNGDPYYAALALGCRVAEESELGKRVMTFASRPKWINMDDCETFTDMAERISNNRGLAGTSTNFYKALKMILDVIEEKKMEPEQVEGMVLAIFSDMQINECLYIEAGNEPEAGYVPDFVVNEEKVEKAKAGWQTMYKEIELQYAEVGRKLHGSPLTPPHILFWNLRKTDGFPALTKQENCSMMSGYDPATLNEFCNLGLEALQNMTPWNMCVKTLMNPRYDRLAAHIV